MENASKYKNYLNTYYRNHIAYLNKMEQMSPNFDLEGVLTQEFINEFEIEYKKATGAK